MVNNQYYGGIYPGSAHMAVEARQRPIRKPDERVASKTSTTQQLRSTRGRETLSRGSSGRARTGYVSPSQKAKARLKKGSSNPPKSTRGTAASKYRGGLGFR